MNNIETFSLVEQLSIFLKTILIIPLAIIVHFIGAVITLVFIPTTVYDMIYQSSKSNNFKRKR